MEKFSADVLKNRMRGVRRMMRKRGLEALILPVGSDLAWLTGYRGTSADDNVTLVVRLRRKAVLLVSVLEAAGAEDAKAVATVRVYHGGEQDELITRALGISVSGKVAVGDQMWASRYDWFRKSFPFAKWEMAHGVIAPVRRFKDQEEIEGLRRVANSVDAVIQQIQNGIVPLRGRTEEAVARDIMLLLLQSGHDKVDFVIVAHGPNAANPHHVPGQTIIGDGVLLIDIGGTQDGYCSDTTRCLYLGSVVPDDVALAYQAVESAYSVAFRTACSGLKASEVDKAARDVLRDYGYGDSFVHSTGHGIGRETHEAPSISLSSRDVLQNGDAFSIEPGVYFPGRFGLRLENIVVVFDGRPMELNRTPKSLVVISG